MTASFGRASASLRDFVSACGPRHENGLRPTRMRLARTVGERSPTTSFSQLHWLPLLLRASPTAFMCRLQWVSPMRAKPLGEAASSRLKSCEWMVDVRYIPSQLMYQVDAARCRVSLWCVTNGVTPRGDTIWRGCFHPTQELRMDGECQVHPFAPHLPG